MSCQITFSSKSLVTSATRKGLAFCGLSSIRSCGVSFAAAVDWTLGIDDFLDDVLIASRAIPARQEVDYGEFPTRSRVEAIHKRLMLEDAGSGGARGVAISNS